jgi:hypothetical protein
VGIVYENLDQPGWVVKMFYPSATSPLQAGNEYTNPQKARAIRPDNVVKAQPPADPRQGWIVKEEVIRDIPSLADRTAFNQVEQELINGGVQDVVSNLWFGHTVDNPIPRWILLE